MAKTFFRRFTKKFFIVSNIILAILFLLASYTYLFNPQPFWFLGLLTLGAFYLLLLLIIFLIFWLFVKPKWALLSLITMVLAYPSISNLLPLRFTASFEKKKAPYGKTGGIIHFGFRLKNAEDIVEMAVRIKQAGGKISSKGEFCPGEPYIFFKDPDGYEVEIWYELIAE